MHRHRQTTPGGKADCPVRRGGPDLQRHGAEARGKRYIKSVGLFPYLWESGTTENRIEVSIDWAKVPTGEKVFGTLEIASDRGEKENVYISVFNPSSPSLAEMDTLFVEHNGYVTLPVFTGR